MEKIKKFILVAFFATTALGITSCNSDVEPIVFTPQSQLAFSVADIMRNGLFGIFAIEEAISAQIAKGEELPSTVVVITNDLGDTTGWKSGFDPLTTYFRDSLTVTFSGSPLGNGSVKTIDCSKLALETREGKTLKVFGIIEVTNVSTSANATSRDIHTQEFGWGEMNNDVKLNANYTFNSTYSNKIITECKVSGSANGNHITYETFSQDITTDMIFGQETYFTGGSMTLTAPYFGGFAAPIDVSFSPSGSMTVTYNGETSVY
ncbi:MAG: hypothetical protein LBP63_00355 [Prevotellaceae bacterium]|jgi:hypothetical protein|nr:hypothetical protein [Prevotellaceae bacterium]